LSLAFFGGTGLWLFDPVLFPDPEEDPDFPASRDSSSKISDGIER